MTEGLPATKRSHLFKKYTARKSIKAVELTPDNIDRVIAEFRGAFEKNQETGKVVGVLIPTLNGPEVAAYGDFISVNEDNQPEIWTAGEFELEYAVPRKAPITDEQALATLES